MLSIPGPSVSLLPGTVGGGAGCLWGEGQGDRPQRGKSGVLTVGERSAWRGRGSGAPTRSLPSLRAALACGRRSGWEGLWEAIPQTRVSTGGKYKDGLGVTHTRSSGKGAGGLAEVPARSGWVTPADVQSSRHFCRPNGTNPVPFPACTLQSVIGVLKYAYEKEDIPWTKPPSLPDLGTQGPRDHQGASWVSLRPRDPSKDPELPAVWTVQE